MKKARLSAALFFAVCAAASVAAAAAAEPRVRIETIAEPPEVVARLLPSATSYEKIVVETDGSFWRRAARAAEISAFSVREKSLTIFRAAGGRGVARDGRRAAAPRADTVVFIAARGMHGPVYMAVAVGWKPRASESDARSEHYIKGIEIVKHGEIGGAGISEPGFLGRFVGRGFSQKFFSASDTLTGATVSSRAVAEGALKSLAVARMLEQ